MSLFEVPLDRLLIRIETAIARKGGYIVQRCLDYRAWQEPPTAAQEFAAHWGAAPPGSTCFTYNDVAEWLCRENPWLDAAHKDLRDVAGTAGSSEATGDLLTGPTVPLFCRVATLAVELLEAAARLVRRPLTAEWQPELCDEDWRDRRLSDRAMEALTRRQSGWEPPERATRFRPAVGGDANSAIERAVFGADVDKYLKAWVETDDRIYIRKWGDPRRAIVGESLTAGRRVPEYTTAHSLRDVKRAYDAFAFANRTGRIFNSKITVSWFLLRDETPEVQWACFTRFYRNLKQRFRDLRADRVPDAADRQPWIVHVHENPRGALFHTHLAVVVPAGFPGDFPGAVRGLLDNIVEGYRVDETSGTLVETEVRPADANACVAQWYWFHYMMKGGRRDTVLVPDGPDGRRSLDDVLAWRYVNPGPERLRRRRLETTINLELPEQRAFRDAAGNPFVSLWDEQVRSGQIDVRQLYSDRYLREWRGEIVSGAAQADEEEGCGDALRSLIFR